MLACRYLSNANYTFGSAANLIKHAQRLIALDPWLSKLDSNGSTGCQLFLKVIAGELLNIVRIDLGYAHALIHHQLGELFALDKDNSLFYPGDIFASTDLSSSMMSPQPALVRGYSGKPTKRVTTSSATGHTLA